MCVCVCVYLFVCLCVCVCVCEQISIYIFFIFSFRFPYPSHSLTTINNDHFGRVTFDPSPEHIKRFFFSLFCLSLTLIVFPRRNISISGDEVVLHIKERKRSQALPLKIHQSINTHTIDGDSCYSLVHESFKYILVIQNRAREIWNMESTRAHATTRFNPIFPFSSFLYITRFCFLFFFLHLPPIESITSKSNSFSRLYFSGDDIF